MSSATPSTNPPLKSENREIRIVSHSNLFYWWPVWALCLILALLTRIGDHQMAIVPAGTRAELQRTVQGLETDGPNDLLVVPKNKKLPLDANGAAVQPHLYVSKNKSYGVIFVMVLLLVIIITNVPLRGLWSVVVIIVVVMLSIIFALADWWEPILDTLGRMHIHINALGYLLIAVSLFTIWILTFVFFDSQIYMVFTPGQLRVRSEIGGGEVAYDTMGMVTEKQRNDLFRHWILGLGSGDLVVRTSGSTAHQFDLPNVLFVGYKVKQLQDMLREKPVVQG